MFGRRPPGAGPGVFVLIIALAVGSTSTAISADRPSVRLEGSTVPRAKALALDAALLKGWKLAESGRDYVIFETPLDTPASPGPADARATESTLLRIHADFIESDGAVTATLRAEEVWRPFTPREWTTDISETYRGNLERALASLHRQWNQFLSTTQPSAGGGQQPIAGSLPGSDQPRPLDPVTLRPTPQHSANAPNRQSRARHPTPAKGPDQPAPSAGTSTPEPVGVWAFDAERVARRRGCELDDRGAVLVSDKAGIELHRIGCLDHPTMLVRCSRQRCWAADR